MKKINYITLISISILLLNGCKKTKDGEPGKDGNANVYAHTYSVSNWSSGASWWYTQLSFAELTSDNINTASVQVYRGTVSNNWIAIPYTYVNTSGNYFMNYLSTTNLIEVRWQYNGLGLGDNPNTVFGATSQFKVVVIPPAIIKQYPNIDLNNYSEVKKVFDLKD